MKGRHINIMGLALALGGGLPIVPHSSKPWIAETKLRSGWHIVERREPTRAEKKAKRKRRQKAQRRNRG